MDGVTVALFLTATFAGAVANGLAGFAFGLVAAGIWLQILTPIQSATLIVGYGTLLQLYGIWKLRYALDWRTVSPLIAGGLFGVPVGVKLLTNIDPTIVRVGVGTLLILYSLYGLTRPTLKPVARGVAAKTGIGFLNGVLGGLTGLTGAIVTIWCGLQGWPKDQQRTVYQPVILAAFLISAGGLGFTGAVTVETIKLYIVGLPVMLAGVWLGMRLYGRLDDDGFRKTVLLLLLVSGLGLIAPVVARL